MRAEYTGLKMTTMGNLKDIKVTLSNWVDEKWNTTNVSEELKVPQKLTHWINGLQKSWHSFSWNTLPLIFPHPFYLPLSDREWKIKNKGTEYGSGHLRYVHEILPSGVWEHARNAMQIGDSPSHLAGYQRSLSTRIRMALEEIQWCLIILNRPPT